MTTSKQETQRPAERVYTVVQAADVLSVSTDTVARAIRGGQMPAKRVGRGFRVRASDLDAWYDALPDAI